MAPAPCRVAFLISALLLADVVHAAAVAPGTLTLVLSGEALDGPPEFAVSLGGQQIGSGAVLKAIDAEHAGMLVDAPDVRQYLQSFRFDIPNMACARLGRLTITFTNDAWGGEEHPSLDRNLYIASASVNGHFLAPADFSLMRDGEATETHLIQGLLPLFSATEAAEAEAPGAGWPDKENADHAYLGSEADCRGEQLSEAVTPVYSGILNFDLTITNSGRELPGDGGGMALHDKGVVIARPIDGSVWLFERETRVLRRANVTLPTTNYERMPEATASGHPISRNWLRYNDIEIVRREDGNYLLASYSYYDEIRTCVASRLAAARLSENWTWRVGRADSPARPSWEIVFETTPCLGFFDGDRRAFAGNQAGGRIAPAPGGVIYLTVGDYEFDGVQGRGPVLPQLSDNGYGKIFRISLSDWSAQVVSSGHRNPQGITVDSLGRIWETEHGPQGGDELNLITPGTNYGWPYATLGMGYGDVQQDEKFWPYSSRQGRHDFYAMPTFSWTPSIAPSAIKSIHELDERWDGDLLIGTLADQSLHRLRLENGRVIGDERVGLDRRVRYLEVGHGRIYLLFDDGAFGLLTPHDMTSFGGAASPDLEALARYGCMECHSAPSSPQLSAVFGSPIAAQSGVTYSQALRNTAGVWDTETLRAFLTDTEAFAPGTGMPQQKLPSAAIEELIAALASIASRP
jgi:cytochrome c2